MVTYYPKQVKKTIALQAIEFTDIDAIVSNNISTPVTKMRDEGVAKCSISITVTIPPDAELVTWYESQYSWLVYPKNLTDTDISNLTTDIKSVLSGLKTRNVKEVVLEILVS